MKCNLYSQIFAKPMIMNLTVINKNDKILKTNLLCGMENLKRTSIIFFKHKKSI